MDPVGHDPEAEEQAVLLVLIQEGRANHCCTSACVAMVLGREAVDVVGALERLEQDGLVSRSIDARGQECWRPMLGLVAPA